MKTKKPPRQNIEPHIGPAGMGEGIKKLGARQTRTDRGRKGPSPTLKKVLFSNFLEPTLIMPGL